MKLLDKKRNQFINCPKCGKNDFTDFDMQTETSTFSIFCTNEECKQNVLIPTRAVKKDKTIEIV